MHLTEEQVAAFVSGALSPAETHSLEVHLEGCSSCLQLVGLSARTALRGPAAQRNASTGPAPSRYVVLHELGSGSMGAVYAAYDTQLDRRVALKRIKGAPTEERRKHLQREAQVMARLEHPHIAAVYDIGVDDEGDYIAMQLEDGGSLRQWLREEPRSSDEVLEVFLAAGEGLAAAHTSGITHRDFKPENVLIGKDRRVRVTDFGLARYAAPESVGAASRAGVSGSTAPASAVAESLTRSGTLIGTPLYMSPEQLHGGSEIDGRSDQFSYCVALFEALTGTLPFEGRTLEELRRAVASGALPSRSRRSRVPSAVWKILLRGLSPRSEDRFPTMEALVSKLRRARTSRRRLVRTLSASAVLVMLAAAAIVVKRSPLERCAAPPPLWATVWSEPVRAEASAAFDKTRLPFAGTAFRTVDAAFAQFLDSWAEQRREACTETHWNGTQPEALLQRQLACLDRRLLEARALTTLLRSADESVVSKAPQAVGSILTLSACKDPPTWMVARTAPGTAPSPARLAHGERIAELRALRQTGSASVLLEKARALQQAYQEDPTLDGSIERAEALGVLADAHLYASQVSDARERYVEMIQAAERAGAEDLRANAELSLAWTHAVAADRKAARESLGRAVALLDRIPESVSLRMQRLKVQTVAAQSEQRHADAVQFDQERVKLAELEYGPGSLSTAMVRSDLAMSLAREGRLDEARIHLLELVPQLEKHLGLEHPDLGIHLRRLSEVELHLGRSADTLVHAQRALSILEPRLGTSHLEVAGAQLFVAIANAELLQPPAIVAPAFARARDMLQRVHGPDHPQIAMVLVDEARYWAVRGDAVKAEPLFERACGMQARILTPDDFVVANCWAAQGQSYLDLGMPQKARPLLQKARSQLEKLGQLQSLEGLMVRASLASLKTTLGDPVTASRDLEQLLQEFEALPSRPAWDRAAFQLLLAEALASAGPGNKARIVQLASQAERVFKGLNQVTLVRRAEALLKKGRDPAQ